MADNRVAYGLAKKYGIDTSGMSPKEVWEALKEKGVTPENVSNDAYDSKEINKPPKPKTTLTKQEWALWYKAVAENKKLGYWAEEMPNGDGILRIETNDNTKIIITSGTFENPKAKAIYSFKNSDELIDFINIIKGRI